jgi:hypothetical protein
MMISRNEMTARLCRALIVFQAIRKKRKEANQSTNAILPDDQVLIDGQSSLAHSQALGQIRQVQADYHLYRWQF